MTIISPFPCYHKVTGPSWLSGWSYRKSVTLSRASGAVTNYQMKVLVGESSGATGEAVDCNSHCKTDFTDLRFTTSDGVTLLDHWLEQKTGTTPNQLATVWVECDSIGTDATTFYMYYGKADAPSVSNGANTFIVFDDFERGSDGDAVGGSWIVSSGSVKISTVNKWGGTRGAYWQEGTTPQARVPVTASDNIAIAVRFYRNKVPTTFWHGNATYTMAVTVDASHNVMFFDGVSWVDTGTNSTAAAWHKYEFRNFVWATPTVDIYFDDALASAAADISFAYSAATIDNALYCNTDSSSYMYVDNVVVRNFRATEPAWGSWGSEESV